MTDKIEIDIDDIINKNIDKNKLKYPKDKSNGKRYKYNKL